MAGDQASMVTDDYTILHDNESNTMIMKECVWLPPMVDSTGMWSYIHNYGSVPYTLPLLQLQMVIVFIFTQASYYILKRYGIPKFTTQLIVCALFRFLPLLYDCGNN
jgi:branched-subunit amino acid transport protein AzlD